tara:strand:- start:515 stop:868 length:354 start_codon:yes stop_codon:yes gene_type:complete
LPTLKLAKFVGSSTGPLDRQVVDIQNLEHQLNDASVKSREQQHKSEQLVDNIAALTSQKADVDKQVAVLSQALEATKTDMIAAQNRVGVLFDENKMILQEKAVIQGQFKQLQESLSR